MAAVTINQMQRTAAEMQRTAAEMGQADANIQHYLMIFATGLGLIIFILVAVVVYEIFLAEATYTYFNRNSELAILREDTSGEPLFARLLVKLALLNDKDQASIVGDLIEEFREFESRLRGYVWVYKQ